MVRIDLIIPFHDELRLALNSIESALESKQAEIHVIVIDDRKNKYPSFELRHPHLTLLETPGLIGYQESLNLGISKSKSQFVAFQDADDLSLPERLIQQVESLVATDGDISNCGILKISKTGKILPGYGGRFKSLTNHELPLLLGSYGANSSWVIRRDVLKDPSFMQGNYRAIDWATALRCFSKFKVTTLSSIKYLYVQHDSQMTKSRNYQKNMFNEIYPLWRALNKKYELPELSLEEARSIADPWGNGLYNDNVRTWVTRFMHLIDFETKSNLKTYKGIIGTKIMTSNRRIRKNLVPKDLKHVYWGLLLIIQETTVTYFNFGLKNRVKQLLQRYN